MNLVNIKGGKELYDLLQTLPVKLEKNIMRGAMRAGAKVIADEAKRNVSVKSGALKKSIRISTKSKNGRVSASVKAGNKDTFYVKFVEFGTARHLISVQDNEKPLNKRRGIRFNKVVSMTTINRNVLRIGNTFIGKTVEHPGARAKPFMRPAFDAKGQEAIDAVIAYINGRLNKQGLNQRSIEVNDSE